MLDPDYVSVPIEPLHLPFFGVTYLPTNPLHTFNEKKLSMQYCLKLSSAAQNSTYDSVFDLKFQKFFDRRPNQIQIRGY